MNTIIFQQKITNDIIYKGDSKNKQEDNYSKTYTKKKYFFGICFYHHHFNEELSNNDNGSSGPSPVGFNNRG